MRMWIVDAFADRAFAGAQSAVVPLEQWPSDAALQAIASECRMPETAFIAPMGVRSGYELRWFTPQGEAPLGGHAALAAGVVVLGELQPQEDIAVFDTQAGALVVRKTEEGYALDLPRKARFPWDPPSGLAEGLGGANIEDAFGGEYATVVLPSEGAVRRLEPDLTAIAKLVRGPRAGCLAVTAQADEGQPYDFVLRFFAPGAAGAEEVAMGAAFADIAPYWCDRLGLEEAVGLQCSRRGAVALARPTLSTVRLLGQASVFLRGEIDPAVVRALESRPRRRSTRRTLPRLELPAEGLAQAAAAPGGGVRAAEPEPEEVRVVEEEAQELTVKVYDLEPGQDGEHALERVEVRELAR